MKRLQPQRKNKWILLLTLIALLDCTISISQVKAIDSTSIVVPREEFQSIVKVFIDYQLQIDINKAQRQQIQLFQDMIVLKDSSISQYQYQLSLKPISAPPFYNTFWFGYATGTLAAILLFFAAQ